MLTDMREVNSRRLRFGHLGLMVGIFLSLMSGIGISQGFASQATPPVADGVSRAIVFHPEETGSGTFVTIEAEPGSRASFNVVLGNAGNIDQIIRTGPTVAISGPNGGFLINKDASVGDGPTSWVEYPEQEFELNPGEGIVIEVIVTVPANTSPGEYVTALFAEQAEPFGIPGDPNLNQIVTWPLPVLIVVPGDRVPAFEVGDAQLGRLDNGTLYAEVEIANTGNVTVRPTGSVRLMDASGTVVGSAEVAMDSVYTGTSTHFSAAWPSALASEEYDLEISLTAEDGAIVVEKTIEGLVPTSDSESGQGSEAPLQVAYAEMVPLTRDNPPSTLQFNGVIANNAEPIENARVSIVTYQDGVEVDRYPIMQAVTIQQGETPVEARYSLPGGFTDGTYTFEVTIELGDAGTQTVLLTQAIEFEVVVP